MSQSLIVCRLTGRIIRLYRMFLRQLQPKRSISLSKSSPFIERKEKSEAKNGVFIQLFGQFFRFFVFLLHHTTSPTHTKNETIYSHSHSATTRCYPASGPDAQLRLLRRIDHERGDADCGVAQWADISKHRRRLQLVRRREFRASPLSDGQSVQAAILRALWSFDAGRYLVVVARFPLSLSV